MIGICEVKDIDTDCERFEPAHRAVIARIPQTSK